MSWTLRKGLVAGIGLVVLAGAAVSLYLLVPQRLPEGAIRVPQDVSTLGEALARAQPGAILLLDARQLEAQGSVRIETEGITLRSLHGRVLLRSDGNEPALAVMADGASVEGFELVAEGVGVSVRASGVLLEDLLVRAAQIGIQLSSARSCNLQDIEVQDAQVALAFESSGGNVVRSVSIQAATQTGASMVGSWGNRLESVVVKNTPVGFSLTEGSTDNDLVDCSASGCGVAGVEINAADGNRLIRARIMDGNTGVVVEQAKGCSLVDARIERPAVAGVRLSQASQNHLSGTFIVSPADVGILLQQSSENTLAYNTIADGLGVGVRIDAGERNLLEENSISSAVGIRLANATACRVLRNRITARSVGLLVQGGADHRLFDNAIDDAGFGVGLVDTSGVTLLRTEVVGSSEAALVLFGDVVDAQVAQNDFLSSNFGILIDGAARSEVQDNRFTGNKVGIFLVRSGPALRIEQNQIRENEIGLRQVEPTSSPALRYEWLEVTPSTGSPTAGAPILVNNAFDENTRWDVENDAESPLHVAGNWWGEGGLSRDSGDGTITGSVLAEESAWKGTIAVAARGDDLSVLLGRILQGALVGAGYRVIDLIGIQDEETVRQAILARDADLIWWESGTAELELVGAPDDTEAFDLPARRGWVAIVPERIASLLPEDTLSALAETSSDSDTKLRLGVASVFGQDLLSDFETAYGLELQSVTWTQGLDETEALLKFGTADVVLVDNIEETLTLSGFTPLTDDRSVLPFDRLAAFARRDVLEGQQDAAAVLAKLQSALTAEVLHDLISRVRLLHRDPGTVAQDFLKRESLLGG